MNFKQPIYKWSNALCHMVVVYWWQMAYDIVEKLNDGREGTTA